MKPEQATENVENRIGHPFPNVRSRNGVSPVLPTVIVVEMAANLARRNKDE